MAVNVSGVPAHAVRAHRVELEPFFAEFTDDGQVTTDDLVRDIEAGDRQCWLVHDHRLRAVALTQIFADRKKVCRITHLTGSGLHEWKDAVTEIMKWAIRHGCTRIQAIARPGYERVAAPYGFRKTHVLLELDLEAASG